MLNTFIVCSASTYIVCQHQSSSLDNKLMRLLVSHHSSGETGGTGGLPAGIDRTGAELFHMPDKTKPNTPKSVTQVTLQK